MTSTQTEKVTWNGASGTQYTYYVKKLPYSCNPNQDGNYIFTKVVNNMWIPIYIGQGDLNSRINDDVHNPCARGKGATHVHVQINGRKEDREKEESDLLAVHPQAYSPTGCNIKPGG